MELRQLQQLARNVFHTKDGREFFRHLAERFELDRPSFRSDDNFNETAAKLRDGEKGVLQYIQTLTEQPIEKWPVMS